ncbi:hypothetical protein FACS189462_5420 [Spirochaetia bacterium]|nr:hypothetical protein FACS189462_5420 [Spirochaetia bacterium]
MNRFFYSIFGCSFLFLFGVGGVIGFFTEKEPALFFIGLIFIVLSIILIKLSSPKITVNESPQIPLSPLNKRPLDNEVSYFDGGLLSFIGWKILGFLITILTLGICYPLALCMSYGWETNHTVINGKRLQFTGKAGDLFLHWLLWLFLTIITLGIYSFWLFISLKKWIVKNTIMTGTIGNTSTYEAPTEQKVCKKCGRKIDSDYTSCPHCGAFYE